jgi:mannosyltransferase OCH1-like enzyme
MSISLGVCRGSIRRTFGFLASLLVTAFVIYRTRSDDDDVFALRPYDAVNVLTDCSPQTTNANPRIPNVVHQIWKDENIGEYPIYPSTEQWRTYFSPLNYTVKLWTEREILHLITTSYPWLLSTYQSYPQNIQRADVARLAVVHSEGGIYADLDAYPTSTERIHCLQHLDHQAMLASTSGNGGISNHFFMAEKGSEFLLWALHEAKRRAGPQSKHFPLPYLQVFWSTGPLMVTSIAREYSWTYNHTEATSKIGVIDDRYTRSFLQHAAGRSWHGPDGRALNYLADHAEAERRGLFVVFLFVALGTVYVVVRRKLQAPAIGEIHLSTLGDSR